MNELNFRHKYGGCSHDIKWLNTNESLKKLFPHWLFLILSKLHPFFFLIKPDDRSPAFSLIQPPL